MGTGSPGGSLEFRGRGQEAQAAARAVAANWLLHASLSGATGAVQPLQAAPRVRDTDQGSGNRHSTSVFSMELIRPSIPTLARQFSSLRWSSLLFPRCQPAKAVSA